MKLPRVPERRFCSNVPKTRSIEKQADFDEILTSIARLEEMEQSWNRYREDNPYVGDLTWADAVQSVVQLKRRID